MALVSVCIPTRNRPSLVRAAIESVLRQGCRPLEILVGDDSDCPEPSSLSEYEGSGITMRYQWNKIPKGQAGNVNSLLTAVRTPYVLLLHDDDLLLPNALRHLLEPLEHSTDIVAVFGKQQMITNEGALLVEETEALNEYYYRTSEYAGSRLSALESALVQQFPNDGYLVRTAAAQRTLYRTDGKVGEFGDFDFGIRLALLGGSFFFVDVCTAQYRKTATAVSSVLRPGDTFEVIENITVPKEAEWAKQVALGRLAPISIVAYSKAGEKGKAFKIFSSHYPLRRKLSFHGMFMLTRILISA